MRLIIIFKKKRTCPRDLYETPEIVQSRKMPPNSRSTPAKIYHNICYQHRMKRNPHVSAANGVFPSPFPAQNPEKRP